MAPILKIDTTIPKLLNIIHPIICAPMHAVSGGVLATKVTEAGGLGLIGAGYCSRDWLETELNIAKKGMFGVGFITWKLADNPTLLDLALEKNPRAIWLSFGDITPFVDKIKKANIPLICQVQTVQQAKECKANGADIIVAQGAEAGGHGATRGAIALIPAVVDAVTPLPVLAAGGICDARGVAASFILGAQGVVMGTRFLAAKESLASEYAKTAVVKSSGDNTTRTRIFDYARGFDWPKPYTARALNNKFITTMGLYHKTESITEKDKEFIRIEYNKSFEQGNNENMAVFAGEGIDMIHDIPLAQTILERIVRELHQLSVSYEIAI